MNGAEYLAEFLVRKNMGHAFVLTGGACALMIDALHRHPKASYTCFLHEQAAAMAADAVWRVDRARVGVSMATSGPGATNLLTGIACSYFDSIPSFHVTGQVNLRERANYVNANVRQAGFQETKIEDMARPITKHAVMVRNADELKYGLAKAYEAAVSGRRGPVLVDIPMDVQQTEVGDEIVEKTGDTQVSAAPDISGRIHKFLSSGDRPLILLGGGVGLAGVQDDVIAWLRRVEIPFVASWSGLSCFDHGIENYCGGIGVYGNRGANFILQNCDRLLVLGSRLDNRQRSGNPKTFAPAAKVFVLDIDEEELRKYEADGYETGLIDFSALPTLLHDVGGCFSYAAEWRDYAKEMKQRYYGKDLSVYSQTHNTLSPYAAIKRVNDLIDDDAIVVADTGANLCWLYQIFQRKQQTLFTAGGHSPMGYALPAAIGAKVTAPERQVVCFTGDGGIQLNIQELQTLVAYGIDVDIIIQNNNGYGIIKQFQDSYTNGRYAATTEGYSAPHFGKLVEAYGLNYRRIEILDDINESCFRQFRGTVLDVILGEGTQIEPKLEMGRPINDQYPYADDVEFSEGNRYVEFERS